MKPMHFHRGVLGCSVTDWKATYEEAHKEAQILGLFGAKIQSTTLKITKANILALLNGSEIVDKM